MSLKVLSKILYQPKTIYMSEQTDEEIDFWRKSRRYEIERGWRETFRQVHQEFIEETVKADPDWAKGRRVEFLTGQLAEVFEEVVFFTRIIFVSRGEVYQWLGDMVRDDCLVPLWKRMKKIKMEIQMYELAPVLLDEGLSSQDIEMAKQSDPGEYLEIIREENNRAWALCPFHKEKKPSFCWYKDTQSYYCYGCNRGGDLINLVMDLYDMDFIKAVESILKKH